MRKIKSKGVWSHRLMYNYEPPSLFSGKRGAALIAVILLHIVIVWGFYTGLAGQLVQKIIPPVEIAQIEKPKDVDKPPPPPPKLEEIKPLRSASGIRRHPGGPAETTAISEVIASAVRRRPRPWRLRRCSTPFRRRSTIRSILSTLAKNTIPMPPSGRARKGAAFFMLKVSATGQILDATIQTSSGFPRLDEACLKGVKGQKMGPAMEDGKPVEGTFPFAIQWKLSGK